MTIPHDIIGIGFGPSHLSLAIAAEEEKERSGRSVRDLYLDLGQDFSWQPGMLLEDSRLQVAFLKDLITMVNPRSRHTFVNYLFEHARLHQFINLRTFYPTRAEYNDYYRWVARAFEDKVHYRTEVISLTPELGRDGRVDAVRVDAVDRDSGSEKSYTARNLTIAIGGQPHIPAGVAGGGTGRAFHSSVCKQRLEADYPDRGRPYRFVVVGSGQTAGDVFLHLCNHYPNATVSMAMRGFAFKPQDDTHFVNELFFPEVTDLLYGMDEDRRGELLARHRDVTHSAVDIDLLPVLYDAIYRDQVDGRGRLKVLRFLELTGTDERGDDLIARFRNLADGGTVELEADGVILATGYDRDAPLQLLDGLAEFLERDASGRYRVERCYGIKRVSQFRPKVYLQGYCEPTHGFSEVLLSLLPVRSAEILADALSQPRNEAVDVAPHAWAEDENGSRTASKAGLAANGVATDNQPPNKETETSCRA